MTVLTAVDTSLSLTMNAALPLHHVREALNRVGKVDSLELVIQKATIEACRGCGLDRAIYFVHDASRLELASAHSAYDAGWLRHRLDPTGSVCSRVEPGTVEATLVRRRTPLLLTAPADHAHAVGQLLHAAQMVSYVAAPVVIDDRVVGVIYADRQHAEAHANVIDRDMLWAFAEGFGYTLKHVTLLDWLRVKRDEMCEILASTEAALRGDIRDFDSPAARRAIAELRIAEPTVESEASWSRAQLTQREQQVLALLVEGASNADIADQLVITKGTVKCHVKNILRKTSTTSRSQLISRYVRHLRGAGSGHERSL